MRFTEKLGHMVGSILGVILAACGTVCIGALIIAITLKLLTWLF